MNIDEVLSIDEDGQVISYGRKIGIAFPPDWDRELFQTKEWRRVIASYRGNPGDYATELWSWLGTARHILEEKDFDPRAEAAAKLSMEEAIRKLIVIWADYELSREALRKIDEAINSLEKNLSSRIHVDEYKPGMFAADLDPEHLPQPSGPAQTTRGALTGWLVRSLDARLHPNVVYPSAAIAGLLNHAGLIHLTRQNVTGILRHQKAKT